MNAVRKLKSQTNDYLNLLGHFLQLLSNYQGLDPSLPKQQKSWVNQVDDFIHLNYSNRISVGDISKLLMMDRTYISREYHRQKGKR